MADQHQMGGPASVPWAIFNYASQRVTGVVRGSIADANQRARMLAERTREAYGVYRFLTQPTDDLEDLAAPDRPDHCIED